MNRKITLLALAGNCGGRAASGFDALLPRARLDWRITHDRTEGPIAEEHSCGECTKAAAAPQQHVAARDARSYKAVAVHETPRKVALVQISAGQDGRLASINENKFFHINKHVTEVGPRVECGFGVTDERPVRSLRAWPGTPGLHGIRAWLVGGENAAR